MLLSFIVYSFLAGFLWLLAKDQLNSKIKRDTGTFWTWQNIISILLFAVIYGARYNVGVDNLMYINIYEALGDGIILRSETLEVGYQILQRAFVGLDLHYSIFIGFWGALQVGLVYYAMRRNKYLLPLIALFIVLGPTWLSWANIMRQAVAECGFILMIEFVVDKKIWKYMLGVILCSLVHKSALFLLPFYFLLQKPVFPKNKWMAVGILLCCTVIGLTPAWIQSVNFIESVLSFLDYDTYTENFNEIMADQENFRAWGPARAGIWFLYVLATWIYLFLREIYKFSKRFDIYFECFFFGNCAYELVANTSQIFVRPVSYFQSFALIVVPICIYYLWKSRKQNLYLIMCAFAFFNTYWWTIKAYISGKGDEAFEVYKFFFMQ